MGRKKNEQQICRGVLWFLEEMGRRIFPIPNNIKHTKQKRIPPYLASFLQFFSRGSKYDHPATRKPETISFTYPDAPNVWIIYLH